MDSEAPQSILETRRALVFPCCSPRRSRACTVLEISARLAGMSTWRERERWRGLMVILAGEGVVQHHDELAQHPPITVQVRDPSAASWRNLRKDRRWWLRSHAARWRRSAYRRASSVAWKKASSASASPRVFSA
jgi:hypothetical protein